MSPLFPAAASPLHNQRILVTGGGGFLGQHVCSVLATRRPAALLAPRKRQYDLCDAHAAERLLADTRPDVVLHLAAVVGGIAANRANPGRFLYENALMGLQLIEAVRRHGVKKLVVLGTICSYPKFTPVPFREEDLWNGYPEETNAPYGLAKKLLLVQAQAYREQYGLNAISLLPVNLYGPGDNFDPETSHVIPALIRKVLAARATGEPFVEVWGTGVATREFLFVRDAAEGIVLATERYDGSEPVNLGSGQEISIRDLALTICELANYRGEIRWDSSRPDGQPRRCLDATRAWQRFGFRASTPLRDGLKETLAWYEARSSTTG
jgi:GDP-L-fucose synthase